MDTRKKIVSLVQAKERLKTGRWLVFGGTFDPLTAAVANRFDNLVDRNSGRQVLAVVFEDSECLLTGEERCILVAALRTVDSVVALRKDRLNELSACGTGVELFVDPEADRKASAEFAKLVLSKADEPPELREVAS